MSHPVQGFTVQTTGSIYASYVHLKILKKSIKRIYQKKLKRKNTSENEWIISEELNLSAVLPVFMQTRILKNLLKNSDLYVFVIHIFFHFFQYFQKDVAAVKSKKKYGEINKAHAENLLGGREGQALFNTHSTMSYLVGFLLVKVSLARNL